MGLAASQARLLTITSRLSDNELRSQSINNAKLRLATESSNASQAYINALNNANMMFANYDIGGTAKSQVLTYNALTSYSSYNNQYSLVNPAGQILVNENEAAIFKNSGGNLNAYLKSHGIKWDTTYFDPKIDGTAVSIASDAGYPEEFQNVNNNVLKDWYESYNAYVNSVEMYDFNSANYEFTSKYASMSTVVKKGILKDYADSKIQSISNNVTNFSDLADCLGDNGFIGALKNYMTDDGKNRLGEYEFASDSYSAAVDVTQNDDGSYILDAGILGSYKYDDGKIYNWSNAHNDIFFVAGSGDDVTYYYGKDAINALINNADADNTIKAAANAYLRDGIAQGSCEYGTVNLIDLRNLIDNDPATTGSITISSVTGSFNDFVSDVLHDIYEDLIFNDEYFNTGMFIFEMLDDYVKYDKFGSSKLNTLFGNLYTRDFRDQPVSDWVKELIEALDAYLKSIEGEKTDDPEDGYTFNDYTLFEKLKDGDISPDELRDMDSLLKKLGEFGFHLNESNSEIDMTYTKDFRNVVRGYLLDTMIDEYGEPKYTWIDENDTTNSDNPDAKAQWYTNLFNRMKKGYAVIENGLASSKEWVEYALESGLVTMEQVDKAYNWVSLDYTTCSNITESTNTDAQVAKAEAAYNKAMRDIEAKDKAFDMELRNIETEHNALEKEADTLKNVMKSNIERTMKFDQSS